MQTYDVKNALRVGFISLDEKSARRIARGRISQLCEERRERARQAMKNLPGKRLAWVRAMERSVRFIYGDSLIWVCTDKRRLLSATLEPPDERPGALCIAVSDFPFLGWSKSVDVAVVSAHAIGRLIERDRSVDPVAALSSELFPWSIDALCGFCNEQEERKARADTETVAGKKSIGEDDGRFAILPTVSGFLTGVYDFDEMSCVFTTWYCDRTVSDAERAIVARLRSEEKLGRAEKLRDVVF